MYTLSEVNIINLDRLFNLLILITSNKNQDLQEHMMTLDYKYELSNVENNQALEEKNKEKFDKIISSFITIVAL